MHYESLISKINEIHDLRKAIRVLKWDREVSMPAGGDADRINQIATLERISHALYRSDEMGELIELAAAELNGGGYLSTASSLVRFLRLDYAKARLLPADFIRKQSIINNNATTIWKTARENDDFALYKPWLAQIIELAREQADLLGFKETPYDALLDRYELGATTAQLTRLFEAAKDALIPLYRAIGRHRTRISDSILRQPFDVERQAQFAHYIAGAVGFDFSRGQLATAVHPFSTNLSRDDVRITTRYSADYLAPSIFATLHEAGHAIYIQNIHPELSRTLLAKETSAGLDESQSRLVENMIGRSRGFWSVHFPKLQALFPSQLGTVTLDQFYAAINKVQPGYIRVEADELTYNMHIILRFEIERDLICGALQPDNLADAWDQSMRHLLGIKPPNDRLGCLQDVHWNMVGFGYFPTYALGNLYAAQFYEAAAAQEPSIPDELERGQLNTLMAWLHDNVHQHGRKLTPEELVLMITGSPLDHEAFTRYVTRKYSELYDL